MSRILYEKDKEKQIAKIVFNYPERLNALVRDDYETIKQRIDEANADEDVKVQAVPYKASRPITMLYFENTFFLRPVPDQVYAISLEAYVRPTQLLNANQTPELEQWAQYVAYGAAKKIYEDRMDLESVALILPGMKEQELLVNRRNVIQRAREKVKTEYDSGDYLNRSPFRRW